MAEPLESETYGIAHFSIDGEGLTDIVRSLVTEGRWRHALRILSDGLPGISVEECLSILRGDCKLVGVNDLDLVPDDDAAKHKALLAWQFGHLWHRPDGEWEPYATVTHFGAGDVSSEIPMYSGGLISTKWADARIRYYMDNASDISTVEGIDRKDILWRRVEDPPLWIRGLKTSAEALEVAQAAGHRLEKRGGAEKDLERANGMRAEYKG
jgi:hypothetical protein